MFKSIILFVLLFSFQNSYSQEIPQIPDIVPHLNEMGIDSMIEIKGGARVGKTFEALFQVDIEEKTKLFKDEDGSNNVPYFVIVKFNLALSSDNKQSSFADVEINTIGIEAIDERSKFLISAFNVKFQRNVDIGLSSLLRISFVGIRGSLEEEINSNLKFLLAGAIDLVGVAYTERLSDLNQFNTNNFYAVKLETGLEINKKFRFIFGADMASFWGDAKNTDTFICDDTGNCSLNRQTEFMQTRRIASIYSKLLYKAGKNMRIFAQISRESFSVTEKTGRINSSSEKAILIQSGIIYSF